MKKHFIYRHFTLSEFDSPDKKHSGKNMDPRFMVKLDKARAYAEKTFPNDDFKFIINSGFRTYEHNRDVYQVLNRPVITSQHELGLAADISAITSRQKFVIISSLLWAGFHRIGIGPSFIHVDLGHSGNTSLSKLIWTY